MVTSPSWRCELPSTAQNLRLYHSLAHNLRHVQPLRAAAVQQRPAPSSRLRAPAATAKSAENGIDSLPAANTGGGGDIGDNGSGGGGGGGGNNPGFSGHMWSLLALAGAAWAVFQAYQRSKQLDSEGRGFFGGPQMGAPGTPR